MLLRVHQTLHTPSNTPLSSASYFVNQFHCARPVSSIRLTPHSPSNSLTLGHPPIDQTFIQSTAAVLSTPVCQITLSLDQTGQLGHNLDAGQHENNNHIIHLSHSQTDEACDMVAESEEPSVATSFRTLGSDDSDGESSISSHGTLERLTHSPFLPSVSSATSFRHLTDRLAEKGGTIRHKIASFTASGIKGRARSTSPATTRRREDATSHPSPRDNIATKINPSLPLTANHPPPRRKPVDEPVGGSTSDQVAETTSSEEEWSLPSGADDFVDDGTFKEMDDVSVDGGSRVGPDRVEFTQITEHWTRLRQQRDVIKSTFQNIKNEQKELLLLRQRKSKAEEALKIAIRDILPQLPQLGPILEGFEKADLAYQKAEVSLTDLIDELEEDEIQLELQERRFFTAVAQSDSGSDHDEREAVSRPESRTSLRGIPADRPEDIHPLFEELRESFDELHLAKEFQTNLRFKKNMLDSRRPEHFTDDDKDFLNEFEAMQAEAHADVEKWTETAKRLEKECLEKGVMPPNTPFKEEGFLFNPVFRDDIYLGESLPGYYSAGVVGPKTLAHPHFPLLLSNPSHLLKQFPQTAEQCLRMAASLPLNVPNRQKFNEDAQKERGIETLLLDIDLKDEGTVEWQDKQVYINRWLLHKLRQSAMEAELLSSTFQSILKILNSEQWQRDVIFFWSRDGAANNPEIRFAGVYENYSNEAVQETTVTNVSSGTAHSWRGM